MNKVVRLQSGRFITKKIRESDPNELAKARPEEIWMMNVAKSRSGKTNYTQPILIRDMETTHIMNVLRQLYERAHNKMKQSGLEIVTGSFAEVIQAGPEHMARVDAMANEMFPQYKTLKIEMETRLGKRQRDPEPVKSGGRGFRF